MNSLPRSFAPLLLQQLQLQQMLPAASRTFCVGGVKGMKDRETAAEVRFGLPESVRTLRADAALAITAARTALHHSHHNHQHESIVCTSCCYVQRPALRDMALRCRFVRVEILKPKSQCLQNLYFNKQEEQLLRRLLGKMKDQADHVRLLHPWMSDDGGSDHPRCLAECKYLT